MTGTRVSLEGLFLRARDQELRPDTPGPLGSRGRLSLHEFSSIQQACRSSEAEVRSLPLRGFDQFHLAVAGAVQDQAPRIDGSSKNALYKPTYQY
jgi:hypothetical protein